MTWNDVSKLTALCASQACPVREGCLRYQGWLALPQEKTQWLFVSPSQAAQAGEEGCPMFASAAPVRMAVGFAKAMRRMPAGNVRQCVNDLALALGVGQRLVYKMRKGNRALTPEEQTLVARVLAEHGAPQPVEFDGYEERYLWPD